MRRIAVGKQAEVWEDDDGTALWIANQSEAHADVLVGWALCRDRLGPPNFPLVLEVNGKAQSVRMEFVRGGQPKSWKRAQADAILRQLEAAGVWHRDIRLSNLIERPGGEWCLLDFGWACLYSSPCPAPWYLGAEGRKAPGVWDDAHAMGIVRNRLDGR